MRDKGSGASPEQALCSCTQRRGWGSFLTCGCESRGMRPACCHRAVSDSLVVGLLCVSVCIHRSSKEPIQMAGEELL
uniref:Uncharacterized protein n=1 Tax=Cairina moschata TaxID=8855 RepID=A0A8C3CRN3_CAIMO